MILNFKLFIISLLMYFNVSFHSLPNTIEGKYTLKYELYTNEANDILEHYPKRRIEGWMMAKAYIYCLKEYNIEVPLNIALSQGLWESGFGKTNKNNPYNIRGKGSNYHNMFGSTEEGVLEYYKLMCTDYLVCKTEKQLLSNLTNCSGKRYAESPTYELALKRAIKMFEKYKND